MHNVAITLGLIGAIPIPGLDVAVDICLKMSEADFYRGQLVLDDNSLRKFAYKFGQSVEELQMFSYLQSKSIEFIAKYC